MSNTKDANNQKGKDSAWKKLCDKLGRGAPLLLAFYLLIFCNFTAELLGPEIKELLRTNAIARHVVGFFLMYFLIVLVDPSVDEFSLLWALLTAFLVYAWFFISTKCSLYVTLAVLALLAFAYLVAAKARNTDNKKTKNVLTWVQDGFSVAAILTSIGGCIYAVVKGHESLLSLESMATIPS